MFGNYRTPTRWRELAGVTAIFIAASAPAFAHDVKDPVCRMTVDSDTTLFREKLGNKTFYFCSAHCRDEFLKSPKSYVEMADELAAGKHKAYKLSLSTVPHPLAGHPTPLALAVRYADDNAIVPKFELTHEELLHLMIVSDDMRWFEHQHPYRDASGIFRITWTFPHPGRYYFFCDYTPADGDNQVQRVTLDVGPGRHAARSVHLPRMASAVTASDMQVALQRQPVSLVEGDTALFTYRFKDAATGKPVSDMQPFIGAMGHLMIVRKDRRQLMHTHVVGGVASGSYQAAMLTMLQAGHDLVVTPDMATPTGPAFTFKFTLPAAGEYMTWAQFMRHNKVVTVPLALRIEAKPPMKSAQR